jgi:LysM repeat protein
MLMRLFLSICFIFLINRADATVKIDSIGVENLNGKKTIVHKVEAKENYYSIARKYRVSPQSIQQLNNNISLKIGTILKVPTDRPYEEAQPQVAAELADTTSTPQMTVVDYKVGPREHLLLIARKFNTTVEDLKKLNNLSNDNLTVGQLIKVPYGTATAPQIAGPPATTLNIPDESRSPTLIDSSMNAVDRLKLPPARYGLREVDERGVAVWLMDESLDGTKMLALHQTAPIGTVIKITNQMSGKSTFTKVVGKFTQNESTRDAIIVITKAVADLIGALDKRFRATIVYGVPNE